MKKALKIAGIVLGSVVVLIAVLLSGAYVISGSKLKKKYDDPATAQISVSVDSATLARGEHLANAVGSCGECHGTDFGGKVVMDAGPIGIAVASNLTRGNGGVGAQMTDQDWVKAIRHGLRRDNTSLIVMPSEAYTHFNDQDLGALISYLKQLPPVDRENPKSKLRVMGRTLLAANKLPMLSAELAAAQNVQRDAVPAGVTVEYGKYLATTAGCNGCHLPDLTGGVVIGPPGSPPSANLTPAGNIGKWNELDFFTALRQGKRPDGTVISDFMPWKFVGRMTDEELRAIWMYLQTVPAKETVTSGQ
jgi:cytochrome c553